MARWRRNQRQIEDDIKTQSKVCCVCEDRKSFDAFYNLKNKSDGKSYRCKVCDGKARQKWTRNNPERSYRSVRSKQLKYKYGITLDQYEELLKSQDECCAICGLHYTENKVISHGKKHVTHNLSVDHNHKTGDVRGLLCNQCNCGLGLLGDTEKSIEKVLVYLNNASVCIKLKRTKG